MYDNQVEVSSKTTKAKQMVPAHWLNSPVLGADFELTPSGRDAARRGDGPNDGWYVRELEAYMDARGIDRAGLTSKPEHLEAIAAFTASHTATLPATQPAPQTPDAVTGQGPTATDGEQGDDVDGTTTPTTTPGAGDEI